MSYGICNLSIVPIRKENAESSEMISQLLFGETFNVIKKDSSFTLIELKDGIEGYIDSKQYQTLNETDYQQINNDLKLSGEIIDFISDNQNNLFILPLGAHLPNYSNHTLSVLEKKYHFDGKVCGERLAKSEIISTAYLYVNTPFLRGGKTPFGIDSSGLVQMVYKLCGYDFKRTADKQSKMDGEVLSFIEESEPGDLAFFDDDEGNITHVGIILNNYNIIHSYGKVRIDSLDHSGIFNIDIQKHTHKLRMIKKII